MHFPQTLLYRTSTCSLRAEPPSLPGLEAGRLPITVTSPQLDPFILGLCFLQMQRESPDPAPA